MKLFGYEIAKSRVSGTLPPQAGWQLRPTDGQGPFTPLFAQFVPRKIQAQFFNFLVESIPICAAAIDKLITLDGIPVVTGQNQKLVDELNEWLQHVPVNDIQNGFQAFHQAHSREAFRQGFALGEFITNAKRNDIIALRVADSTSIKFSREEGQGLRIYQRADNDIIERELNQTNLLYFSVGNEAQNPYGVPVFRGCEFVTKILTTIYQSTLNTWERFGDPSFSVIYKTSRKDGADLETRRKMISDELNTALRAKQAGRSADFVRAIDTASDIEIKIIGADGQILDMTAPMAQITQDICGKVGLPPWMLGYSFSTTERRANFEAEMVLADVAVRQAAKGAGFERLLRTLLQLRGRTWSPGDWQLEWKQVNLHDLVAQAQARFLNAQADQMSSQGSGTGDQGPGKSPLPPFIKGGAHGCGCDHDHVPDAGKMVTGGKETQRPTPWPELDQVEADLENRLKADWADLQQRVFTIARLTPEDTALAMTRGAEIPPGPPLPRGEGVNGVKEAGFTFSTEQRAAILDSLKTLIGEYALDAENSPVTWYYGQAYSLGLIRAAAFMGKERPILDLIKNRQVFDALAKDGFALVKDNATTAIVKKIIPEMEAHVIAGTNPLNVAQRLETLFGQQNASWERLARTEMGMAAESAKLDEWRAQGVNVRGAIVSGKHTHPRCRCTNVVQQDQAGEWRVLFVPAPDACAFCVSLGTGPLKEAW